MPLGGKKAKCERFNDPVLRMICFDTERFSRTIGSGQGNFRLRGFDIETCSPIQRSDTFIELTRLGLIAGPKQAMHEGMHPLGQMKRHPRGP